MRGHLLAGQSLALGGKVVDPQLELGEHRLAEECPAIILHDLAEVEELFFLCLGPLDHHVGEQQLVRRRRDLGGEGWIAGQLVRLGRIGEQAVHRVTPFVGVGREPVIFVAEVEQQIGVNVVGARVHVGARRLARPRQRIHPALGAHVREEANIVRPQRLDRIDRQLAHLREAVGPVGFHQRRVNVPIAHVRQPEHPPAKLEIAVEHGKPPVRLGNQRAIDRLRDVGAVERGLERAVVMPRLGPEQIALRLCRERRAERVLERLVAGPKLVEHQLAVGAVGRSADKCIALVVETGLLAVAELDGGTRDIGRGELVADVLRPGERRTRRGEQLLLIRRQGVRRLTQGVVQAECELVQPRVGRDQGVHPRRAERDDLGTYPGRGFAERGENVLRLLLAFLVGRDPAILIGLQRRISVEARGSAVSVGPGLERGLQRRRALAELALIGLERRDRLQQRLPLGFPRRIAGKEIAKVPGGSLRRRGARGLRDGLRRRGGRNGGDGGAGHQQIPA